MPAEARESARGGEESGVRQGGLAGTRVEVRWLAEQGASDRATTTICPNGLITRTVDA